jgi:hypothetical protein
MHYAGTQGVHSFATIYRWADAEHTLLVGSAAALTLGTLRAYRQVHCCGNGVVESPEQCEQENPCCRSDCQAAQQGLACANGDNNDDDGNQCTSHQCDGAAQCVNTFTPDTCVRNCNVWCFSVAVPVHAQTAYFQQSSCGTQANGHTCLAEASFTLAPCALDSGPLAFSVSLGGVPQPTAYAQFSHCTQIDSSALLTVGGSFSQTNQDSARFTWLFPSVQCADISKALFSDAHPNVQFQAFIVDTVNSQELHLSNVLPNAPPALHLVDSTGEACLPSDLRPLNRSLCFSGTNSLTLEQQTLALPELVNPPCDPDVSPLCHMEWAMRLRVTSMMPSSVQVTLDSFDMWLGSARVPFRSVSPFSLATTPVADIVSSGNGAYALRVRVTPTNTLLMTWLYDASFPFPLSSTALPLGAFVAHSAYVAVGNRVFAAGTSATSQALSQRRVECASEPSTPPPEPTSPTFIHPVVPHVVCSVTGALRDRCATVFGYTNPNNFSVDIPLGNPYNMILPAPFERPGQISSFAPGRVDEAFAVVTQRCKRPFASKIQWHLRTALLPNTTDSECHSGCGGLLDYVSCVAGGGAASSNGMSASASSLFSAEDVELELDDDESVAFRCASVRVNTPICTQEQISRWL